MTALSPGLVTELLALIFAAFVGFSATQMLRGGQAAPSRTMPGVLAQTAVRSVVGAGGGSLPVLGARADHAMDVKQVRVCERGVRAGGLHAVARIRLSARAC
jgi:hypothetical protein